MHRRLGHVVINQNIFFSCFLISSRVSSSLKVKKPAKLPTIWERKTKFAFNFSLTKIGSLWQRSSIHHCLDKLIALMSTSKETAKTVCRFNLMKNTSFFRFLYQLFQYCLKQFDEIWWWKWYSSLESSRPFKSHEYLLMCLKFKLRFLNW